MKIFYNNPIFKLPFVRNFDAMVLGQICLTSYSEGELPQRIINHEMIHQEQMKEFGKVRFYLIYLWDFIKNLIKYRNVFTAYYNIPFEVEAYAKQGE